MTLKRGSNQAVGKMMLRGGSWLLGGRIARALVTLGGIAILARLLTPADFGAVAVAAMILPLSVALLDGLIEVPLIREDALDRTGLSNLIWSAVIAMAGLGALIWVAAPWLAQILNSPRLVELLRVLCVGLILQPFVSASSGLLRRQHRFAAVGLISVFSSAAYIAVAVLLALLGHGVWSLIAGQLLSLLVTAVVISSIAGIPVMPVRHPGFLVAWRLGGLGFTTRLLAWLWANLDTLFASSALGAVGAGIYSRAYNITTQLKEPFAVLDQTVRQAFVAQKSLCDKQASAATLGGLRLIVLMASLVASVVIVMRDPIVAILLGSQWEQVVVPLAILTASFPARVARMYLDSYTYARGSMPHMVVRNAAIVALMSGGLWLWADNGVIAISMVVAGVNIAALFLSGGSLDRSVAGTVPQRLAAMFPGFLLGAGIILLVEGIALIFPLYPITAEWVLRVVVSTTASLLVMVVLPDRWLPSVFRVSRNRFTPAFLSRVR